MDYNEKRSKQLRRHDVRKCAIFAMLVLLMVPLFAEDAAPKGFGMGLGLGTDLLPDPSDPTKFDNWSKLALRPEAAFGKFGIGLDLTLRFQFSSTGATPLRIYEPDWIPNYNGNGTTVFDLYLPKILYIRYGYQWEDPFYIKMGSISDFSLGNGLIMDNYANTKFLPQKRLFGIQVGLDGSLFKFPYVGIEALTGNVSRLDVIGGRFYLKPLAFLKGFFLGKLQVGAIGVYDKDPLVYLSAAEQAAYPASEPVYVIGADVTLPLLQGGLFSLTTFAEGAREYNEALGAAAGIRGKILRFIDYGAQVRFFQAGFIPAYFDGNYDLYRADRFKTMMTTKPVASTVPFDPSFLAHSAFALFNSSITFSATLDAPFSIFTGVPIGSTNQADYPHLLGTLKIARGLIPNTSISAWYEKYYLGAETGNVFKELIDPTNASIGMEVSYKAGSAVVTVNYAYIYNPAKSAFDVKSSLSVGFEL